MTPEHPRSNPAVLQLPEPRRHRCAAATVTSLWFVLSCVGPAAPVDGDSSTASVESSSGSGGVAPAFDVGGAWALVAFDLGDGLQEIMPMTREDAFLLHYDEDAHVMTTAACGNDVNGFGPQDSACRLSPSTTMWRCRCFAYAFEAETMRLVEFDAGTPPPMVDFAAPLDDAVTVANLTLVPDERVSIASLPTGVFDATAQSRFEVEARSLVTFGEVYEDPDGRAGCAPCVP